MKVLAIETSTSRTEVAFLDGPTILFAECFEAPRRETGPLFSMLERAVAIGGNPDRVAVGTGPGSYNGIRAGIATAEALALGFGVPVIGICSLRGYSMDVPEFAVIGDARSQQFYFAQLQNGDLRDGPRLIAQIDAPKEVGSLPLTGPAPLEAFSQLQPAFPSAVQLAQIAQTLPSIGNPPEPIYLKPAHITSCKPPKGR